MPSPFYTGTEFAGRHRKITDDGAYRTYEYHGTPILKVSKCRNHIILPVRAHKGAINLALRAAGVPLHVYQEDHMWRIKRTSSAFRQFSDPFVEENMRIKLV